MLSYIFSNTESSYMYQINYFSSSGSVKKIKIIILLIIYENLNVIFRAR